MSTVSVTSTRRIMGITVSRTVTEVPYDDAPEASWERAMASTPSTARPEGYCSVCGDVATAEGYCARDLPANVAMWEQAHAERVINRGGSW